MFDFLLGWLTTALAIVALIEARRARYQARTLQQRLDALEADRVALPRETPSSAQAAPPSPPSPPPLAPAIETPPAMPPLPPPLAPPPLPQPDAPPAIAAARPGFEETIGTRWVVWVGGLTLALGGFFLVRYSIEQGLIGPEMRTALGGVFALALLSAGEWTRRKETASATIPLPFANIPAILTAAGTAVAFATVYVAYALYDFLAPATAFVLLGAVALATMAAALLHGPALAGLGVVAAFVTPVLVSSEKPDYWSLYIYLAVVSAAALGLARMRLWRWLALTAIVLAVAWLLPCLADGPAFLGPQNFHVIAGFVVAALLVVCGFAFGPAADGERIEFVSSGALAAWLFASLLIVLASGHADSALIVFGLLTAATLAIAWRAPAATAAVAIAAGCVAIVFLEWAVRANPDMLVLPGGPLPGIGPKATDESVSLHLTGAAIFAASFGVGGYLAQQRAMRGVIAVIWSAVAVFTPLAILIGLYARISHFDRSIPFAVIAIALAGAFAFATGRLSRSEQRPGGRAATALFATGAIGALALALTFALEKGWLTIALALTACGTAWVASTRPIAFLRALSAILAAIVVARIGYEPRIAGDDIGTTPIFNWLLWGYGVPALSFWSASVLLRRGSDDAPLRIVETAAILFTVLLVFTEIRHWVTGGDIYRTVAPAHETALEVSSALAMAIGLERLRLVSGSIVHNVAAVVLTVFAGIGILLGLMLLDNPMIWPIDTGGVLINKVLLGYGLPAILAAGLAYVVAGHRHAAYANTIAAFALLLALTYVSFEIRRFYHGPVLSRGPTSDAEQYSYSLAWLGFGVVLLGAGLMLKSQRARLASAAVIAFTVLKVFLVDMSSLTGVFRALSFIGLGLVLMAIGWFYQRILFRSARAQPETLT